MEFDKSKVFTAVNADELRQGDKVIVAYSLGHLKHYVEQCAKPNTTVKEILDEENPNRFVTGSGEKPFPLAYLVERKENCTNCGSSKCGVTFASCFHRCDNWKPKTEKHTDYNHCEEARKAYDHAMTNTCPHKNYRPFKDTDELIKVWGSRCNEGKGYILNSLDMPHIWVRQKECSKGGLLITYFGEDEVKTDMGFMTMSKLLSDCIFTDGSPCGVEE